MKINFLTTNSTKFNHAKRFFDGLDGYELVQHPIEAPEIQSDLCEEIARQSAVWAAQKLNEPCVKMDVGFFIPALGGFPGPFAKYVNDRLTSRQLLRLLEGEVDRRAYFIDALAIGYMSGSSEVFTLQTPGKITERLSGAHSKRPIDSIFIPDGYSGVLAEMTAEGQSAVWSDDVWLKLVEYLSHKQTTKTK